MSSRRLTLALLLLVFYCEIGLAAQPIRNWPAPPTWTPPRTGFGARVIQSDVTGPVPFIGVSPCRVVDSRNANGPFGGPIFSVAEARTYALSMNPACTGFPAASTIQGYSVNITVTQTAGTGFVSAYPSGTAPPLVSTVNFVGAGQSVSNAAVVPADSGGSIDIYASQQTHVIIDVNGYYGNTPGNQSNFFSLFNNSTGYTMFLVNSSTSCTGPCGLRAATSSTSGAYAVEGDAVGGSGVNYGVFGSSLSTTVNSAGVYGRVNGGITNGVWGQNFSTSDNSDGVFGVSESTTGATVGVWGRTRSTSDGAKGVYGEAVGTTGRTYGVYGFEASTGIDSAGVRGVDASGSPPGSTGYPPAGVRGESKDYVGVLGLSQDIAVAGIRSNSSGTLLSAGFLGYLSTVGVFYNNGLAGSGTKSFVEPHPTDATKLIKYVSIEGPEAGVYFRGRSQAHRGLATIDVPEYFRMVAADESLSIQVTPIGDTANVAVLQIDLNRIVVKTTRDVEFFYTVNGVRKAYPTWDPIQENRKEFVPEGPDAKLPKYLSANETQRLIDNGTYNPDGTVNMQTAERVGWTKAWAEREARAKEAAAEAQRNAVRR